MFLPNKIAGFFRLHHQYLWKGGMTVLDFLHRDNFQREIPSEIITGGYVWSGKPSTHRLN